MCVCVHVCVCRRKDDSYAFKHSMSCCVLLALIYMCIYIQWNPSNPDIIGPEESVLIKEVSFISGRGTWGGRKCPV